MAVYVDRMRAPFRGMVVCHMLADTDAELHAMAAALGLRRAWHQKPGTVHSHYDIDWERRARAVGLGAVELGRREVGQLLRRRRLATAPPIPHYPAPAPVLSTPEEPARMTTRAYGATAGDRPLEAMDIERRAPGPRDVQIDIAFCGVCHSDLHTVRAEWAGTQFPCVPGHEIVGHVSAVGAEVTRFKVGETVGVGCMVDSCQRCASCAEGLEQYCEKGFTGTYNGRSKDAPGHTLGGYAERIVVSEKFVLTISHPAEQLAAVAPLLCAGITTYSPLKHWQVGPGQKVGIVGIGGLGHMGIKIAHALGAHVVAFTTSEAKRQDAHRLGADQVINTRNREELKAHANSFDFILDTVAASHELSDLTGLLKRDGTLTLAGVPEHPHPSPNVGHLIFKRRAIAGSLIGGIAETQEMLDFCAHHGITSDIEMIPMQKIDEAYDRMQRSDVKYRFVIDSKTLGAARAD